MIFTLTIVITYQTILQKKKKSGGKIQHSVKKKKRKRLSSKSNQNLVIIKQCYTRACIKKIKKRKKINKPTNKQAYKQKDKLIKVYTMEKILKSKNLAVKNRLTNKFYPTVNDTFLRVLK